MEQYTRVAHFHEYMRKEQFDQSTLIFSHSQCPLFAHIVK